MNMYTLSAIAIISAMSTGASGQIGLPVTSRSEVPASMKKQMDMVDENRDGVASTGELEAVVKEARDSMSTLKAKGFDQPGGQAKASAAQLGVDNPEYQAQMKYGAAKFAMQADENKDGNVTLAEMEKAAYVRFDMVDTNKDGQISGEERVAAKEAMRSKMDHGGEDHHGKKPEMR